MDTLDPVRTAFDQADDATDRPWPAWSRPLTLSRLEHQNPLVEEVNVLKCCVFLPGRRALLRAPQAASGHRDRRRHREQRELRSARQPDQQCGALQPENGDITIRWHVTHDHPVRRDTGLASSVPYRAVGERFRWTAAARAKPAAPGWGSHQAFQSPSGAVDVRHAGSRQHLQRTFPKPPPADHAAAERESA
jgi:hypothetical protein